jgi:segregation and condensation protein B
MNKEKLKSAVESLLFVSGEPVKITRLAKICNVGKNEIEEALEVMGKDYDEQKRGLRIIRKADSVQLGTTPENADLVGQLVRGEINADLSKPALETLSIIAYRGPITRVQIEAIRGVNCSYVLRSLLMRALVERRETADIRGYLYEISFDFLRTLGIQNVKELPEWENLSRSEKIKELLGESAKP